MQSKQAEIYNPTESTKVRRISVVISSDMLTETTLRMLGNTTIHARPKGSTLGIVAFS
jgi:hypothetical protein